MDSYVVGNLILKWNGNLNLRLICNSYCKIIWKSMNLKNLYLIRLLNNKKIVDFVWKYSKYIKLSKLQRIGFFHFSKFSVYVDWNKIDRNSCFSHQCCHKIFRKYYKRFSHEICRHYDWFNFEYLNELKFMFYFDYDYRSEECDMSYSLDNYEVKWGLKILKFIINILNGKIEIMHAEGKYKYFYYKFCYFLFKNDFWILDKKWIDNMELGMCVELNNEIRQSIVKYLEKYKIIKNDI